MSAAVDWSGLADLGLTVEPITVWPGPATPASARRESPFKVTVKKQTETGGTTWDRRKTPMTTTARDLTRELTALRAHHPVLRLALGQGDIRGDGFPKANARLAHPGIVLSFVARGVRGTPTLTYAVDEFTTWQDNLRAAALGMEAQRKLKRYGIAQSDQQYAGYRELPQATTQTPDEARDMLAKFAGVAFTPTTGELAKTDKALFKMAAKAAQNDEGAVNAVMNAARTLGVIT